MGRDPAFGAPSWVPLVVLAAADSLPHAEEGKRRFVGLMVLARWRVVGKSY